LEETLQTLSNVLVGRGIVTTRALGVAINTKFLRPNSGPDTDALIAALVDFWQSEEYRLACAIDLRVIAASAARNVTILGLVQRVLRRVGDQPDSASGEQVYNLLQSLLWLDCRDSCPNCIDRSQRYQSGPKPSRALLKLLLVNNQQQVETMVSGWEETAHAQLAATAETAIVCAQAELANVVSVIAEIIATPVDIESQLLFPVIDSVEYRDRRWITHLVLPELTGE
jgi:hypothetical protein